MHIPLFVSLSLETGLLCAKHTFLAKQAYFSKENLRPKNIQNLVIFLSHMNNHEKQTKK